MQASGGAPGRVLLGLSAAMNKLPIAVIGLGNPGWAWWEPAAPKKYTGLQRAAQILHAVAPETPLLMSDGADVIVANRPTEVAIRQVSDMPHTVWLATECNSWPVCYRDLYAAAMKEEWTHCTETHGACFANSGIALGRPSAMHAFYDALLRACDAMRDPERWGTVGARRLPR